MNKVAETNPIDGNQAAMSAGFGGYPPPQMATALALTDMLFGGVIKGRNPTPEEKLTEVITLSNRIAHICRELKYTIPSEFDSVLEESKLDAEGILTNIAAIRMRLAEPVEACTCGKCDSCVAGRSDERYDRQRDGQLCDEA